MKLNGIHQFLVYADVNLLDKTIHTINKNIQTLLDAHKYTGLGANAEKKEYMLIPHHRLQDKIII
jgi:hypothetical protein